jgi:hypothetical protein
MSKSLKRRLHAVSNLRFVAVEKKSATGGVEASDELIRQLLERLYCRRGHITVASDECIGDIVAWTPARATAARLAKANDFFSKVVGGSRD